MRIKLNLIGLLFLLGYLFSCSPKQIGKHAAKTAKWYGEERGYVTINKKKEATVSSVKLEILSGWYFEYHDNGRVAIMGQYERGEKHGEWDFFLNSGDLVKRIIYEDGRIIKLTTINPKF